MSFLSTKSLIDLNSKENIISPFDETAVKNGAFELSLGGEVFQTDSVPRGVKKLSEHQEIFIDPGQFALLLTEESVKIPEDKIAFISIKATIKLKGLVNVSGFHVDPGFEGKLVFSVYNAGPYRIVLSRGSRYFPIWFATLDKKQAYSGVHGNQSRIPDDPIAALSQGEVAAPAVLNTRIKELREETDKRIGLLERDQKATNYLAATAIGIVATIAIKLILDWSFFTQGSTNFADKMRQEFSIDSSINAGLKQKKQLILQIDSLQKLKSADFKH